MGQGKVLEVRNLVKRYGRVIALDNVSLTMDRGEFVVVLGPSGSGKSTLLMSIAGFVKPDSGDIFLNGVRINDVPPYRRNVGVVFQSLALFPHMTVYDNVAFPLRIRKMPKQEIRRRVERILDIVKLSGLEKRRIDQLSGGQRQRVAIARTLVFEPSILLLDEPLGALDRKLREEMQVEIRKIHERVGATTLLVTHDQQEAMTMADRIVIMRDGRIEQVGAPEEIYSNPRTLFVAEFMGTSNTLAGVARQESGKTVFTADCGLRFRLEEKVEGRGYVAIKAEHIRIHRDPEDAGDLPPNPAKVVRRFFEGDHVKYELNVNGVIIRVMDREVERVFKPDDQVYITCKPENIRWLRE